MCLFPPTVIVAFVFYNEHRQILERSRKVSQNTLFFLVLDLISKECFFNSVYTFSEHRRRTANSLLDRYIFGGRPLSFPQSPGILGKLRVPTFLRSHCLTAKPVVLKSLFTEDVNTA